MQAVPINNATPTVDVYDYRGLSTDTKLTDAPIGATFLEVDTGDLYVCTSLLSGVSQWEKKVEAIWTL